MSRKKDIWIMRKKEGHLNNEEERRTFEKWGRKKERKKKKEEKKKKRKKRKLWKNIEYYLTLKEVKKEIKTRVDLLS